MKTLFAKMLTGLVGVVVTPLLAKGIVAVIVWISLIAPESAAAVDQAAVLQWLNGLVATIIIALVIHPERKATKVIQTAANYELPTSQQTPVDGISLGGTQAAVINAIASAGRND